MADLRSLAEAADDHDHASAYLFGCSRCAFARAADPQTILALLDALEGLVAAHDDLEHTPDLTPDELWEQARAALASAAQTTDPKGLRQHGGMA